MEAAEGGDDSAPGSGGDAAADGISHGGALVAHLHDMVSCGF